MKIKITSLSTVLLLVAGFLTTANAEETSAFRDLSDHYEAIRLALLSDSTDGVSEHARSMEERTRALSANFSAEAAGVPDEKAAECEALLPELVTTASRLGDAADIGEAREAFFELSKPMGRYRKMAGIEGSMVVFCPMAKKAWIQPHGEIGNPYVGQEMPTCGEVITD